MKKILLSILFSLTMIFTVFGCSSDDILNNFIAQDDINTEISESEEETQSSESVSYSDEDEEVSSDEIIDINGSYSSKDEVALYIHTYNQLPNNFITKKMAQKLGWTGGSLEPYAPGKSIGGDRFGNYEGLLPKKAGRTYTECDIDTMYADKRGAKRIVFSNDGLIYYTEDHYETFTLLYGEE
ncbi:MAG: ribonuclease domain-containing protein [Lachnospiraceae bacterium]